MTTRTAAETKQLVDALLRALERKGSKRNRDGMARYGIAATKVFGVSVGIIRQMAKPHRNDHALALALWRTGWFEARLLSAFVEDPTKVTPDQMNRWARGFENWADCDTACFHLFDKTPHAWKKVREWSTSREEFVRRAAFALVASIALHDKSAPDPPFLDALKRIERASTDQRNFVKKAVSWALRSVGSRNYRLHREALRVATKLKRSANPAARWIGSDAARDLERPIVAKRLKRQASRDRKSK